MPARVVHRPVGQQAVEHDGVTLECLDGVALGGGGGGRCDQGSGSGFGQQAVEHDGVTPGTP